MLMLRNLARKELKNGWYFRKGKVMYYIIKRGNQTIVVKGHVETKDIVLYKTRWRKLAYIMCYKYKVTNKELIKKAED